MLLKSVDISLNIFGNLDVYISFCKEFNLCIAILANQHTASVWAMLPYTPVQLAGSRLNSMWLVILMFESLATTGLPCGKGFALQIIVALLPLLALLQLLTTTLCYKQRHKIGHVKKHLTPEIPIHYFTT